jgi:hypothetical protein
MLILLYVVSSGCGDGSKIKKYIRHSLIIYTQF